MSFTIEDDEDANMGGGVYDIDLGDVPSTHVRSSSKGRSKTSNQRASKVTAPSVVSGSIAAPAAASMADKASYYLAKLKATKKETR